MGANTNKRSTPKRNAETPAFSESRKRLVRRSGLCQANVEDELHEQSAALEQSPCETAGPLAVTTPNNSTYELSTVNTTSEKDIKDEGHPDNECEGGCDERSAATNIAYQHVSGPLQQDALQQDVRTAESTLDFRTISDNSCMFSSHTLLYHGDFNSLSTRRFDCYGQRGHDRRFKERK